MNVLMLYHAWKLRRSVSPGQFNNEQDQDYQHQVTKRDLRSVVTFFALFVCLIGLTLPFFIDAFAGTITIGVFKRDYVHPVLVDYLLRDVYYLITVTDPLILSWNKDVKGAIKLKMRKFANVRHTTIVPSNDVTTSEPVQPSQN